MSEKPQYISVTMVRDNLDGLTAVEPARPYSLRMYEEGDAEAFDDIWVESDQCGHAEPGLFEREFGADVASVGERMVFLLDGEGAPVGTATAWYRDVEGDGLWGLVHWVAIKPEHQGGGLSKALLARVLIRLRDLGHDRARLVTQTVRIPAIRLYLAFGFEPLIANDEEREKWRPVFEAVEGMR
jgi:GNAT superfamily N-acetyltransferase